MLLKQKQEEEAVRIFLASNQLELSIRLGKGEVPLSQEAAPTARVI